MSTETWIDPNDTTKRYKIGTIGWEAPQKYSQIIDALIPTYGLWGGPGWAPGVANEEGDQIRPTENSPVEPSLFDLAHNKDKPSSSKDSTEPRAVSQ